MVQSADITANLEEGVQAGWDNAAENPNAEK